MNNKVYVANLAATATERGLHALFSAHGNVAEVNLPEERESGRPRGFAIVTMATPEGARAAILGLNGKEVEAHVLTAVEHVPARRGPPATGQRGTVAGAAVKQNVSATPRRFWPF